jgi:hypothetical protein
MNENGLGHYRNPHPGLPLAKHPVRAIERTRLGEGEQKLG